MTKHEFDKVFGPMSKALLEPKRMTQIQTNFFYEYYAKTDFRDFSEACLFLARGTPGKLPEQEVFDEAITAAKEMRTQKTSEKKKPQSDPGPKTPQERLQANRAAFEVAQQAALCRTSGKNCWDPEKVRKASLDPSRDAELISKYGHNQPDVAKIFGYGIFPSMDT